MFHFKTLFFSATISLHCSTNTFIAIYQHLTQTTGAPKTVSKYYDSKLSEIRTKGLQHRGRVGR